MTATPLSQVEPTDLFMDLPEWLDFAAVPEGTAFFTRRGLPYRKTSAGSAEQLFDDDDVDDPDDDVFDDWPYFPIRER